jgi:hypothetical protein
MSSRHVTYYPAGSGVKAAVALVYTGNWAQVWACRRDRRCGMRPFRIHHQPFSIAGVGHARKGGTAPPDCLHVPCLM